MAADGESERHLRSLLASYGALEKEQTRMATLIEERTTSGARRFEDIEADVKDLDEGKAEAKDLAAVVDELRGIRKLLVGLLVSVCLACVVFGLGALQIASNAQ